MQSGADPLVRGRRADQGVRPTRWSKIFIPLDGLQVHEIHSCEHPWRPNPSVQECERGTQDACATARRHHLWWASSYLAASQTLRSGKNQVMRVLVDRVKRTTLPMTLNHRARNAFPFPFLGLRKGLLNGWWCGRA